METQYTAPTAIPPPLRQWIRTTENRCVPEQIPVYWKTHEVITILADIGMYNSDLFNSLDDAEKEQVFLLKSSYFKKRFTLSRCIIRHILQYIPGNLSDLVLVREKNRRVRVDTRNDIFLSLSYSGSSIAVTVGKRKIGSDIEIVHPQEIRKIQSSPLYEGMGYSSEKERIQRIFHLWTLVEAYAKLHDMTPYSLLSARCFPPDASMVSYCVDHTAILSIAYEGKTLQDTLLWIDPACRLASSTSDKEPACPLPLIDGDTYVRA